MLTSLLSLPALTYPQTLLLAGVAVYLAVTNFLAFAAFGFDKGQAQAQGRRVPEATLLMLATLGGWIGAKLAQRWFRHKTVKQPFKTALNLSVLVLPIVLATPVLLDKGPDWVAAQIAAYSASYADPDAAAKPSPLGAASQSAKPATPAKAIPAPPEKSLPKRIGPGSSGKAKPSHKTITVGN